MIIIVTEVEVALFLLGEIVNISTLTHCRPGPVGYGGIVRGESYLGVVDAGNGLLGWIAVSSVNVVFEVEVVVCLFFFGIFHQRIPFFF